MELKLETLNDYESRGLLYSQVHPTLPLKIFNYTDKVQWEGLWDDVTLTSRALVVNSITGDIVARPFKKFFNLSEGRTNATDEYVIFEKLDGSLGLLFFYGGDWIFSSRGSFTSEQAAWFEKFFNANYITSNLNPEYTYCFEIIYDQNRVVVDYDFEGVVLTGVFDTRSGEEIDLDVWDLPTAKKLSSDAVLEDLHKTILDTEEGYVVRFSNGERCKIKGAEYLSLHKLMSEMSTTSVWECLYNNTPIENSISNLPDEFFQLVKDYEKELRRLYYNKSIEIRSDYKVIAFSLGMCDDKTFALFIKDHQYRSIMFGLRNGKNVEQKIWKLIKPGFRKL